jgi:hypothetical protein
MTASVAPGQPARVVVRARSRVTRFARRAVRSGVLGVAAAVAVGIVAGVSSRALMRLVTLVAGADPSFTWQGTVGIVVGYVLPFVPGAVASVLTGRRIRWVPLVAAAALLLWASASIALSGEVDTELTALEIAGVAALGIGFAVLPLAQVVVLVRLGDRWRR